MMKPISTKVMNLAHFADQSARRHGQRLALAWGKSKWNWSEFNARINAMAIVLTNDYGVQKGDRILVQSSNCNQLFESMIVCFRIGAVWVPANFRGTPDDLEWQAKSSGAVGMICHADFPQHVATCKNHVRFVIAIGVSDFGENYDDLVDRHLGQFAPLCEVERDDPCWLFFTSGTTGKPKASVLTHGQMAFVITNHLADLLPGTTEYDVSVVVAPLSHGAGLHALIQIARGAASILPAGKGFDAEEIWHLIDNYGVTNIFTVPTILKLLVEDPTVDIVDHSSLRHIIYAGAPMYRVDQIYALKKLGPVLVQYFGLGEVTGNITVLPPSHHSITEEIRLGTCGFARTGIQIQIQDDEGIEVNPNETGEFCVIGPAVFAGYWDNDDANSKAFRNGWFRTGDVGHMDAEGFYYLTGRKSDMYISGGSNIYPREIEEKILANTDISETAVFGIPDEKWGEIGIAICVLRKGSSSSEVELKKFLSEKVARYKMPKEFHFWDSLPKSGYGKITKKMVREEFLSKKITNKR
ncbi:MAG: AMP-binding protein [SAR324 cluster bacterium]|nr:AMP-binding protein [SAR324 cluster bacterium]